MSRIKSRDTEPEIIVRKFLYLNGFTYRLHRKDLPGKPDICIGKYSAAIFIHGCFWHGHQGCKYFVKPKSRVKFWTKKISDNQRRDKENFKKLKQLGWKVYVIWECELKKNRDRVLSRLVDKFVIT